MVVYNKDATREERQAGKKDGIPARKEVLPLDQEENLIPEPQELDDDTSVGYEADVIEMTDDEGNTTLFEIVDYFFYNGEEYAILTESGEGAACDCEECASQQEKVAQCAQGDEAEEQEEVTCYIMKVVQSTDDDGEEIEEFVPVEDQALEAKLIDIASTKLNADDALDDEA